MCSWPRDVRAIRECVAGHVTWEQVRGFVAGHAKWEPVRRDGLFHGPAVLGSTFYVCDRLRYRELPNESSFYTYCMLSITQVFPVQWIIHDRFLICVMHTPKSGYWFLCIVRAPCVLLLLKSPIGLNINSWYICISVCISSWKFGWT